MEFERIHNPVILSVKFLLDNKIKLISLMQKLEENNHKLNTELFSHVSLIIVKHFELIMSYFLDFVLKYENHYSELSKEEVKEINYYGTLASSPKFHISIKWIFKKPDKNRGISFKVISEFIKIRSMKKNDISNTEILNILKSRRNWFAHGSLIEDENIIDVSWRDIYYLINFFHDEISELFLSKLEI